MPHRGSVGRAEERLGGGGAPVDEQLPPVAVGQTAAADEHRITASLTGVVAQADLESEPPRRPEPVGQPVDPHVPFECLVVAAVAVLPALRPQPLGQIVDDALHAVGEVGEERLVDGDEDAVRLSGGAGRVGRTRCGTGLPASGNLVACSRRRGRRCCPETTSSCGALPSQLTSIGDSARRTGSCRKTTGPLYGRGGSGDLRPVLRARVRETGRPHRFWDTRIVTFDDFVTLTRFLSADVRG